MPAAAQLIYFEIEGMQYSARVVSSAQRQQDIGPSHQLEYTDGAVGQEWVQLDEYRQLLTDQFGHRGVPYSLVRPKTQSVRFFPGDIARAALAPPVRQAPSATPAGAPKVCSRGVQTEEYWRGAHGPVRAFVVELAASGTSGLRESQHAPQRAAWTVEARGAAAQSVGPKEDDQSSTTTLPPRFTSGHSQPSALQSAYPILSHQEPLADTQPHPVSRSRRDRSCSPMQRRHPDVPIIGGLCPAQKSPELVELARTASATAAGWAWNPPPRAAQFVGSTPAPCSAYHAKIVPLAPAWSALQPPASLPETLRLSGFITALYARDACGRLEP